MLITMLIKQPTYNEATLSLCKQHNRLKPCESKVNMTVLLPCSEASRPSPEGLQSSQVFHPNRQVQFSPGESILCLLGLGLDPSDLESEL